MSHTVKIQGKQEAPAGGALFSICQSIKTQWLFHCILLTQLQAYLTGWHTHTSMCTHTRLTRLGLGSWCWASWWSPATLEEMERTGENGKRPLLFGCIFLCSPEIPPSPQDPVCVFTVFFFSSPSSHHRSFLQTTWHPRQDGELSSPPAASPFPLWVRLTPPAKWFINKWFCLAEMYHSTSFTLPSYHSSLELKVTTIKHKYARIKQTYTSFFHGSTWCKSVSKTEQVSFFHSPWNRQTATCPMSYLLTLYSNREHTLVYPSILCLVRLLHVLPQWPKSLKMWWIYTFFVFSINLKILTDSSQCLKVCTVASIVFIQGIKSKPLLWQH